MAMNTLKPGTGRRQISLCMDTISRLEQKAIRLGQELTQVHHVAHHDALTGLPNRSLLRDRRSTDISIISSESERTLATHLRCGSANTRFEEMMRLSSDENNIFKT